MLSTNYGGTAMDKPIWASCNEEAEVFLRIYHDDDPMNPREWDNLGTMVCWHKRHNLGDPHGYGHPDDFPEGTQGERKVTKNLYIYDHSGIVLGFDRDKWPFNCPWDAGWVGYMYATHDRIRSDQGCKYITTRVKEKVDRIFRAELEVYNQFLSGDTYGYKLSRVTRCPTCEQELVDEIDSCWGFYGTNWS
jgi:hypothetical protein